MAPSKKDFETQMVNIASPFQLVRKSFDERQPIDYLNEHSGTVALLGKYGERFCKFISDAELERLGEWHENTGEGQIF